MEEKEDIYKKVERDEYVELIVKLHNRLKEENNKEIEGLKKEVKILKTDLEEANYQIGKNNIEIKVFKDYTELKEKGRRDYEHIAIQLKNEVLRRRRCMDYKEVQNFFRFKSPSEAYKLMDKTTNMFPDEIKMKVIKNSNKGKKIICPR